MKSNISLKAHISRLYLLSVSIVLLLVFIIIYQSVKFYIYDAIDRNLLKEFEIHKNEVSFENNQLKIEHLKEWEEREHNRLEVNPVFITYYDRHGKTHEKSPNLKDFDLIFDSKSTLPIVKNYKLNLYSIRQIQQPIYLNGKLIGYLSVGLSIDYADSVLDKMFFILLFLYPSFLIVIFLIAIIVAERSIAPIHEIINFTKKATKNNLDSRIPLPIKKDELYQLSEKINSFLDQIQHTIRREKDFTSEISHELKTPLAIIKGKLEVLIRNVRQVDEYEIKIKEVLVEINTLNSLFEQLLVLARFESFDKNSELEEINISPFIESIIKRFDQKRMIFNRKSQDIYIKTNPVLLKLAIQNLILNALKFSDKPIEISVFNGNNLKIEIKDYGQGLTQEQISQIFEPFYRSNMETAVQGFGLGLAIVNKIVHYLSIKIEVKSEIGKSTTFSLIF